MFRMGFKRNMSGADGRAVMSKSKEEIVELIKSDLKVLSDFLGKKDYFFGKDPHQLDCSAFAHLAQLVYVPIGDIKTWMETDTPNLIALVERIKTKWWSDWEEMTTSLELNTHLPKKELTPEEIEAQKKEEEKKAEEAKKKEEKQKEKVRSFKELSLFFPCSSPFLDLSSLHLLLIHSFHFPWKRMSITGSAPTIN